MVRCKRRVCGVLLDGAVSGGEMERSKVAEMLGLDFMASWLFSPSLSSRSRARVECAVSERVRSSGYIARRRSIWPICRSSRSCGRRCHDESIVFFLVIQIYGCKFQGKLSSTYVTKIKSSLVRMSRGIFTNWLIERSRRYEHTQHWSH